MSEEKCNIEKKATEDLKLVKAEGDEKIKTMADFLQRYKLEFEARLTEADTQINDLQAKLQAKPSVKDVSSETVKERSVATSNPSPKQYFASPTNKSMGNLTTPSPSQFLNTHYALPPKKPKISTAKTEVLEETPSPSQYLDTGSFSFRQPEPPKMLSQRSYSYQDSKPIYARGSQEGFSMLKNKRTLLPSVGPKRVVFKLPSPRHSGDSSSDACTFEVIENDDPFDEIMRSGKSILKNKPVVRLQANVPPMSRYVVSNEGRPTVNDGTENQRTPFSQNASGLSADRKKEKTLRHHKKLKRDVKTYGSKKSPGIENRTPPSKP